MYPDTAGKKWLRCCVPARYVFAVYGFLGLTSFFTMRVILSVAIVAMVNPPDFSPTNHSRDGNPSNRTSEDDSRVYWENGSYSRNHYDWNIRTQSAVLGSFFYGYTLSQFPGGVLAQRFGGKWCFGIALLVSSIFTLATPIVADLGAVPLIVLRALQGLTQGTSLPSINVLIFNWVPVEERTVILNFVYCGMLFGCCCGLLIGGILAETDFLGGWPSIFYVFGFFCFIFAVFWLIFIREAPHSAAPDSEMKTAPPVEEKAGKIYKVPWSTVLTSAPVWALNFAAFGYGWMFYFLLTEMPTYLYNALHFHIKQNGALSSAPYVLQAATSILASYAADRMRKRKTLSVTAIRKTMNSIAAFGSGGCALLVMFSGTQSTVIVGLLYLGMALNGFATPGHEVTGVDMSPVYTGILTGILNTFTNLAGCLAPLVTGEIVHFGHTSENWSIVFAVAAGVSFLCGLVFDVFGSAEVQPWDPTYVEKENAGLEMTDKSQH